ncbi:iron-containing alcohol dehydrogenase [Pseudactinotalea sp. Z1739]|uniref:iron-containing alcohol dehydrogenase n=1 Tax=Pseudactinotalea sp. Z1739 TaxID=3413028 RepID=UPI003C7997FD
MAVLSAHHGILRLPTRIYFGEGAVGSVPTLVSEIGARVFICCDPGLARTAAFTRLCDELEYAGNSLAIWTDIEPELPIESVENAVENATLSGPQIILGYGGGSALDLAKLVALLMTHKGNLRQYYGENAVPGPTLPVIAVPTTAGTGSEVTPVAVVTDPDRDLKVGVSSPYLVPHSAVVDPGLTRGAPTDVIAHSGMDALVHAIESFTSAIRAPAWSDPLPVFVGRNQLSRLLARDAVASIAPNLVRAVQDPGDARARAAMAYGSLLAGMAFGSAGTHLSHAIQYPIGALTKTPHGLGTGLLLPHVLREFQPDIESDLAILGELLGFVGTEADRATEMILMTERIAIDIGLPRSLAEIGIVEEQFDLIVERAGSIVRLAENVAGQSPIGRIPRIVEAAWRGDRLLEER